MKCTAYQLLAASALLFSPAALGAATENCEWSVDETGKKTMIVNGDCLVTNPSNGLETDTVYGDLRVETLGSFDPIVIERVGNEATNVTGSLFFEDLAETSDESNPYGDISFNNLYRVVDGDISIHAGSAFKGVLNLGSLYHIEGASVEISGYFEAVDLKELGSSHPPGDVIITLKSTGSTGVNLKELESTYGRVAMDFSNADNVDVDLSAMTALPSDFTLQSTGAVTIRLLSLRTVPEDQTFSVGANSQVWLNTSYLKDEVAAPILAFFASIPNITICDDDGTNGGADYCGSSASLLSAKVRSNLRKPGSN